MEKRIEQEAHDEYAEEPVAIGLMSSGVFDQAAFDASYGSGPGGRNKEYAFRFAYALASQAVLAIRVAGVGDSVAPRENPALAQAVVRLGTGALQLDEEAFTFAMDYFKAGLVQAMPSWAGRARAPQLPPSPPALGLEAKQAIARAISVIDAFGRHERTYLIDSLSSQSSSGDVPEMLIRAQAQAQRAQISAGASSGNSGRDGPRI